MFIVLLIADENVTTRSQIMRVDANVRFRQDGTEHL